MTVLVESKTRGVSWHARDMIPAPLFEKLAGYVAKQQEVTPVYASRMVEQMLIWLKAVAENPTVRLAMDETVDPAWHAFILHSEEYTAFCDRVFGRYLHHVPPGPSSSMPDEAINRTLPALHATGYAVDEEFWSGHKPCCPPNPCTQATQAPKCSGTGAPPPAVSAHA